MQFNLQTFKASIEAQNVMHGNRYLFVCSLPPRLLEILGTTGSAASGFTYGNTVTFRAENVQLPGMILASADGIPPRLGYGAVEGIPYNIVHEDISVTFGLDDKGMVHRFFYEWLDLIVSHKAYGQSRPSLNRANGKSAYEVEYKDEYVADIDIYVLGPEHNEARYPNEHIMQVKLFRAFPRNVPSLNLSYTERNNYLRFPVQFNYTDFIVSYKKLGKDNFLPK